MQDRVVIFDSRVGFSGTAYLINVQELGLINQYKSD